MKPELSVAIIFKDEIRCIERCLKSLQPLKERVSCEIVMADTGSTDGSRAVAEQYADIVFDFPWINDFSAARNAVLERCSGRWTLVIDCDEWLDGDLKELTGFLNGAEREKYDLAMLMIRDYISNDDWQYQNFPALRLLRMAAKPRYKGAIHEAPRAGAGSGKTARLLATVLHHDGYIMLNDGSAAGQKKCARNIELLRAELTKAPDDLRRLLQFLEAAWEENDYLPMIRHAVELTAERRSGWKSYGAAILRHAIFEANTEKMPEFDEWVDMARNLFPKSYYTRIDVAFILFARAYDRSDCEAVIAFGEDYLKACAEFQRELEAYSEIAVSGLQRFGDGWIQFVRLHLAEAYRMSGRMEQVLPLLEQTDWTLLTAQQTSYLLNVLVAVAQSGVDIGEILAACWEGIQKPIPSEQRAAERVAAFRERIQVNEREEETPKADQVPLELLELAIKVKAILERFPPDDPSVMELKNSEAYRKVAWLIEGDRV